MTIWMWAKKCNINPVNAQHFSVNQTVGFVSELTVSVV